MRLVTYCLDSLPVDYISSPFLDFVLRDAVFIRFLALFLCLFIHFIIWLFFFLNFLTGDPAELRGGYSIGQCCRLASSAAFLRVDSDGRNVYDDDNDDSGNSDTGSRYRYPHWCQSRPHQQVNSNETFSQRIPCTLEITNKNNNKKMAKLNNSLVLELVCSKKKKKSYLLQFCAHRINIQQRATLFGFISTGTLQLQHVVRLYGCKF